MSEPMPRYLFGESDLAARRLFKLAEVFEPSSRSFLLSSASPPKPHCAYDLGCGPGFTTQLIARTLHAENTVGLDNADRFIELAQQHPSAGVAFHKHDITRVPFPQGPAEIVYARFVLAHVANAAALVDAWATQLLPGGRLLLEEVEWIETSIPAFRLYLDTVEAMLADNGSQLYAGRVLEGLNPKGARPLRNQRVEFAVANCDAAAMFVPNIATWKSELFIGTRHSPAEIETLTAELQAQLESCASESDIRWTMRQAEFERV
jgi:SAM-dependent methyltransferase